MYSVLIVDDDRMGRQGIISMMPWEKYGMIVMGEAQNGEKALEFLANTMVDLVFVDLDMPVIDGITLMEKCKELYPETPLRSDDLSRRFSLCTICPANRGNRLYF